MNVKTKILIGDPKIEGIKERFLLNAYVAEDLINRASKAIVKAQVFIKKNQYLSAAEAAGQVMMLARQAEIILQCAMAAERSALNAVAEQQLLTTQVVEKIKTK